MTLTWANPPKGEKPRRGPSHDNTLIIEALKANKGTWARVRSDVNVSVSTWWKKYPGIEAKASTIDKPKGKCDVYARYVGEKK